MSNFKKDFKNRFEETFQMDEENKKKLFSKIEDEISHSCTLPAVKTTIPPTFTLFWKGFCTGAIALFMLFSLISISIIVTNEHKKNSGQTISYPDSFVVYKEVIDDDTLIDTSKISEFSSDGFTSSISNGALYTPIYKIQLYRFVPSNSISLKDLLATLNLSSLLKYSAIDSNKVLTISFDLSSKDIVSKYIFDMFGLLQSGEVSRIVFSVVQTRVEGL